MAGYFLREPTERSSSLDVSKDCISVAGPGSRREEQEQGQAREELMTTMEVRDLLQREQGEQSHCLHRQYAIPRRPGPSRASNPIVAGESHYNRSSDHTRAPECSGEKDCAPSMGQRRQTWKVKMKDWEKHCSTLLHVRPAAEDPWEPGVVCRRGQIKSQDGGC
jgi:hypothetical protein